MQLLHVDSSPLGAQSVSRALTAQVVAQWLVHHPATRVSHLDLASDPPSHLDQQSLGFRTPADNATLSPRQREENARSEELLRQFLEADVVVLGAPMYNFTVPSQLKAWIDRLAQPGRTFRYTAQGPEGLAGGKTLIVVSTRGGSYAEGAPMDHQESYLRAVFGFMGVADIRFVRAEGLAMGDEAKAAALRGAEAQVRAHAGEAANERAAALAA